MTLAQEQGKLALFKTKKTSLYTMLPPFVQRRKREEKEHERREYDRRVVDGE